MTGNLQSDNFRSDTTFGNRSWVRIWITAVVVFVIVLASAELAWRDLGYRPSVSDSPVLWSSLYQRALDGGPRTIALIGASRIQSGISTARIRQRLPAFRPIQLGRSGDGSPVVVLRALAAAPEFRGVVICDTVIPFLMRPYWDDQGPGSGYPVENRIDAVVNAYVEDCLALAHAESGLNAALKQLIAVGDLPHADHSRMLADRSVEIDFTRMDDLQDDRAIMLATFRRRYRTAERPPPEVLHDTYEEIDRFVRQIAARGGTVVFLRMPSSGDRLALEDEYHPKEEYWDRFAASSSGICIHWTELQGARGLICPDDSHLDRRDAIRFTDALVTELDQRRVFRAR